jgi:hypothetical protein
MNPKRESAMAACLREAADVIDPLCGSSEHVGVFKAVDAHDYEANDNRR